MSNNASRKIISFFITNHNSGPVPAFMYSAYQKIFSGHARPYDEIIRLNYWIKDYLPPV